MDYTKDLIRKILNEVFANVRVGAGEDNITQDVKGILKSMGATTIEGRFQALSDPKSNTTKTQEGFAAIMLLQYLRDIKNNFNATSAGFLFEDFIAGILDGSKPSGNPAVDVYDGSSEGYQIKLYNDNASSIKLSSQYDTSKKEQNVKYFIVGIKTGDNINTYIMDINTYNNVKDSSYKIDKIYAKNNKGGKSSRSEKVDLRKLKGSYNSKISKLQSKFKLKDNDGIADYHQAFWMDFVNKKSPSKLDNKTLMGLVKRWAFYDKSFRLDKKNLTDVKTLEWAKGIDKNDHAKMAKDNIRPFEDIFLGIGADILSFMSSVLAANPDKAVRDMKKRLDKTIKDVKKSGDVKKINKLKLELQRLNAIGGTDKIVPNEGIVFVYGGKTFKLTGTFAPLNQILGLFYE